MIAPKISGQSTKNFLIKIDKFTGGTATLINPARLDPRFAVQSINLIQDQDGIWRTRPGVNYWGQPISGVTSIDGAVEYIKSNGTREVIAIAGGYAWKSQDGGAWTQLTGATFTVGHKPSFLHINNLLYISNGHNNLAVYDGSTLTTYSQLTAPTGLSGTRGSGLSSGSYNNYYRVTANNRIGSTEASASVNITTNKDRNYWNETSNEYVDLTWTAVTNATSYDVWHGTENGYETYLGSTSTNSFRDRGQAVTPKNNYIETPDGNTTAAPKFKSMEVSSNMIWATYDPNNPWRVYWSGVGQYIGAFSPFYGGGWVDIEYGSKNKPVAVVHYRTGKGDPIATVLTSSADGKGMTFQIELVSTSVGDETIVIPAVYKVVGSIGTDCYRAVVKVGDNIFFANKTGIFALRNKPQMFNVLSTDNLIQPVRDQWESINQAKISDVVGYYKHPRVYFSFAVGSQNDSTACFDMERNNWIWKWSIGFNGFFEYTDNSGTTHFLAIPTSGNRLVEISDNYEGDYGTPFYQAYISPIIPVDKDYTTMAKIKEVIYELGKFKGSATIEVIGVTKDKQVTSLSTKTIETEIGTSGWGTELFSGFLFSVTEGTPTVFTYDTIKKKLRVNKKIYAIQFKIYTTNRAYFEILGIQAAGSLLPKRAPSAWN
jgi:hypothetical protein